MNTTQLAEILANLGSEANMLFSVDQAAPRLENFLDGRLTLHHWCQWIYTQQSVFQLMNKAYNKLS